MQQVAAPLSASLPIYDQLASLETDFGSKLNSLPLTSSWLIVGEIADRPLGRLSPSAFASIECIKLES